MYAVFWTYDVFDPIMWASIQEDTKGASKDQRKSQMFKNPQIDGKRVLKVSHNKIPRKSKKGIQMDALPCPATRLYQKLRI